MFEKINRIFSGIDRSLSVRFDSIEFAPIFLRGKNTNYLLLKEAIGSKNLVVKESNEVSSLFVINQLDKPVLIIEGQEPIGGRQNRIVNKTVLVRENSKVKIPVSCVERGRWSFVHETEWDVGSVRRERRKRRDPEMFQISRVIDSSIRSRKLFYMTENAIESGPMVGFQEEVWRTVDESLSRAGQLLQLRLHMMLA